MKERPVIFNGEMVRAILDGRKTQTRRVMKPQPEPCYRGGHWWPSNTFKTMLHIEEQMQNGAGGWGGLAGDACPFGQVGDRLWVRETWAEAGASAPDLTLYRSNYPAHVPAGYENVPEAEDIRWRPSIHMPRWASRITLEITGVRVERLQDISEADAIAEGGTKHFNIDWFGPLWASIYGVDSWNANPWVWVIEFRRVVDSAREVERG